jgi:hypothetical protein
MAAERGRATAFDVSQDGVLFGAQRAGLPQRRARGTRDITDLEAGRCGFVSAPACR